MNSEAPQIKEEPAGKARAMRFLGIFAAVVVVCLAGNLDLSYANLGMPTGASAGFCRNIEARVAQGEAMQGPKMVLIGGSGVRRGISAQRLGDALGVPAFNFGLQASFGPELILHQAKRVLEPSDTALLDFEYNHYDFDRWNDIALNAIFGCLTDFYAQTSPEQKLEMLMALPPQRILQAVRYTPSAAPADEDEGAGGARTPEAEAAIAHGDIPLLPEWWQPLSDEETRRLSLYAPIRIVFDREARGTKEIVRFVEWARANDIKVAVTWPNTIAFEAYRNDPGLEAIRAFYEEMGVTVIGDPALGLYPAELFWDTQYHLSAEGMAERTRDLAVALRAHSDILPSKGVVQDRP
jgi:hypothetical protein